MGKKKQPMERTICIKVTDEQFQKLEYTAQVTGKARSAVARDFITNGEIRVYYGNDKIIRKMGDIENRMNTYCLHTLNELNSVRDEIHRANSIIQALDNGILRAAPFSICLNAAEKVNELEHELRATHKNLDAELTNYVNIQSDTKQ